MRVNGNDAAEALARKVRAVERRSRDAEAVSAREAVTIARRMSSGPLSQAQLTAMGHPYARRNPQPPFSAAIINVQTGRFREAWRVRGPATTGTGIRSSIVNESPEAQFLTERGTGSMIGRPIVRAIAQRVRGLRQRRLAAAVRAGLEE